MKGNVLRPRNMVVIEGPDATGKSTCCQCIKKWMEEEGRPVVILKFPNYQSVTSKVIKEYLQKDFDMSIAAMFKAKSIANLYAVDRSITMHSSRDQQKSIVDRMNEEPQTLFLVDRYTPSNILHQASTLEEHQIGEFAQWLFDLEFVHLQLPIPILCAYLIPTGEDVIKRNLAIRGGKPDLLEEEERVRKTLHLIKKSKAGQKSLFEEYPAGHIFQLEVSMDTIVEENARRIYHEIHALGL